MARSSLDSLDYCAVTLDEIALEGLDGITLPTLWTRLSDQPNFLLKIDDASKQFIWNVVKSSPDVEFYVLPEDRPEFVPFNRFEHLDQDFGIVVEPRKLPEDPYPFAGVDDTGNGIRGSCTTYYTRIRVTDQVGPLTLQEAEQRFGQNRLVAVASQSRRNAALVPIHSMDVETELNLSQFVLLERIGRSRFHGEVTVGTLGLGVLKEPPKNLYYLRKKLLEYRLITKQGFCMRGSQGKNCQGRLYHLPRFYREFRPKYQVMIEHATDVLRQAPNYMMLTQEFNKQFENALGLKKVAKMSEFQRFIKWEMVPHRTIYPDAPKSEWMVRNSGLERSCRIYRLLDPTVSVRDALDEQDEDADPDGDAALLKFPDQSNISLHHSLERQAFNLLHVHGARGIDSNNLRKELGQTPLDARALLKSLAVIKQSVETFREDIGRTRITKYVASRYMHMSENKLAFSEEEKRLKSLTVKTESEPEPVLPSLSPAEPVFVVPCAPEDASGPPVLSPVGGSVPATSSSDAPPAIETIKIEEGMRPALDNLIDMEHCYLELIDPVLLEPISAPTNFVPLENTELFSKSSSKRLVKRTRIILEIVQKLKIIDNAYQLRRMVQNSEDDEGILTKMDRKSFNRILKRLAEAGLVKNYRLTLNRDGETRQKHLIADASINTDNSLLRSTIEQAKAAFLVQQGVNSALHSEQADPGAVAEGGGEAPLPGADRLQPDVACSVRDFHRRFQAVIGSDTVEKPHALATRRHQNETYFVPKFRRMQLLQELLFYISWDYSGDPALDQTEIRRQIRQADPTLDVDSLPHAYTANIGWLMFISPLPAHNSWGSGWSLLCDVLLRMPLCIFLRLVNIPYLTPNIHKYMAHKVLRNLPPTHLPEDVVSCLFWKRKYMFSIHDDITRLVFMGLAQFGQQMLAKDQVFVYVNRNASLLDTSISKEGYHSVDPNVQYPVKMYHFDSLTSMRDYWFDLKTIALSTALGSRNLVAGQKVTIEIPFYKPALVSWAKPRLPEEAAQHDRGHIPGDNLGAGGIDTSMFAHVLRNWKWKKMSQIQPTSVPEKRSRGSVSDPVLSEDVAAHDGSARRGNQDGAPRGKKRRRARARIVEHGSEAAAQKLGPVVDVKIHKPADPSEPEKAILVTRGKNLPRTRKRAAPADSPDDPQPGPSKKRNVLDGGETRKLRVQRHKVAVRRIERIMSQRKPKKGPKPPRDEVDKRALGLLKKQRCDWSDRENTYLLLARVAIGLLFDSYKVPSRQYLTVRDALHEAIPEARNKTAHAVQRRIAFMLRRSQTVANVSLTIQEHLMDPDVRNIIGQEPRLTQSDYHTEVVFPRRFREVMAVLMAKYDKKVSHQGPVLSDDYDQLCADHDMVLGDNVLLSLQQPLPEIKEEMDIHLHTAAGLVMSYLTSREDKSAPTTQMYHASQLYPEELMFAALSRLRTIGVCAQHRGKKSARIMKESKGVLLPTSKPYLLSTKFRYRFIQRYQYSIYGDCYNFFKTLLWNSLKEAALTEIGAVQRGGQAALIYSLMDNKQLIYDVAVPENLIRLSIAQEEQGNALMQGLLAQDDGHLALGRAGSSGQRRVGARSSMSRLVLLAARESQDDEVTAAAAAGKDPDGSKKDSHHYYEQLHIVPFTVLARLPRTGEAADGGAGAEAEAEAPPADGDVTMELDESHVPVSPLLAQAVRDKHARMLSEFPPDPIAVMDRLRKDGAVSDEDVSNMKHVLHILDDAGELGMEPAKLLAESELPRPALRRLVALLEAEQLLLRCGVSRLVYVSRAAGQAWVLHSYHMTRQQQETVASRVAAAGGDQKTAAKDRNLQSVYFQPLPWRRISGAVNRRVLDRLAGAVLSHCMTVPGCRLGDVQRHFHPMLNAHHVRLLVETLVDIGCVKLTETRQLWKTTLFSRSSDLAWYQGDADDFSPPESVSVLAAPDAILRFACFVGDKPYSIEFLDSTGM